MTPPESLLAAAAAADDDGFHVPGAEAFVWPAIFEFEVFGIDLSINRVVLLTFLVTAVMLLLFLGGFRRPQLVPRGLQNVMEYGVDFIRNSIIQPVMGPQGLKYLPYLTTVFFFIFFCNVLEIVPGINFPVTSRFGIPVFLALITWVLFLAAGMKTQGVGGYFRNTAVPSGLPVYMVPLVSPIEIVSTVLVRPATLAIRLGANMIAGHLLLTVFFLGTDYLLFHRTLTIGFGVLSAAMSVVLVGFELFVAVLQAYIFTTLSAVYISGALNPEH